MVHRISHGAKRVPDGLVQDPRNLLSGEEGVSFSVPVHVATTMGCHVSNVVWRLATHCFQRWSTAKALILENLPADNPSTAEFKKRFEAAGMNRSYLVCLPDAMSVEERRNVWLSCRNLDAVEVMPVSDLNALSLLRCNNLVMTAAAFEEIQALESQHVAGEGQ